jgi:hypothetical protein
MELYDSTISIQKADCRLQDKILIQFIEDSIEEYLQDQFICLKKHYESQSFPWVNYYTIYATIQNVLRHKILTNKNLDDQKINIGRLEYTESICLSILNKFIPLYQIPTFDNNPNVRQYEYIFVYLTTIMPDS